MGVGLRPHPKGWEGPPNPKGTVEARGAGLRTISKEVDKPPDPKATQAARLSATAGVMGQKSAEAILALPAGKEGSVKGRTREDREEPWVTRKRL